jgi:signal transduction histidine kinase
MSELENHPFFVDWSKEEIAKFCKTAVFLDLKKGDRIFETGDVSVGFFLIIKGSVSFLSQIGGIFREIDTRSAGEAFGAVSMLTGQPHRFRAVAGEDSRIAMIPAKGINDYMGGMPKPLPSLLKSFAKHVARTSDASAEKTVRQEKMALIGTMVNNIVHDFKSPFQMISLGAETIGSISKDKQVQRLCASITEQVSRMLQMATELSEFSKGSAFCNFQSVNLKYFLEKVRDENEAYAAQKSVSLTIEAPDAEAEIEPHAMTRVFQNLISNAVDALPDKDGVVEIHVKIIEPDSICITVSDNGCGIPEKIRTTLWEPFVTAGKKSGTGLGTSIVKSIVEGHGGTIDFTTETDKGTTFTIVMPRRHRMATTAA